MHTSALHMRGRFEGITNCIALAHITKVPTRVSSGHESSVRCALLVMVERLDTVLIMGSDTTLSDPHEEAVNDIPTYVSNERVRLLMP